MTNTYRRRNLQIVLVARSVSARCRLHGCVIEAATEKNAGYNAEVRSWQQALSTRTQWTTSATAKAATAPKAECRRTYACPVLWASRMAWELVQ